jgi:hypothetical protein
VAAITRNALALGRPIKAALASARSESPRRMRTKIWRNSNISNLLFAMELSRKRSREYPNEQNVRARDQRTTLLKLPVEAANQSLTKSDEKIDLVICALSGDRYRGNGLDTPELRTLRLVRPFLQLLQVAPLA